MSERIQYNIIIEQGSDWFDSVDFTHDDGTALNLSGYSFQSSIKSSYYSDDDFGQLDVTITNVMAGNTMLSMNAATTANLSAGQYVYDFMMTDRFGNVTRAFGGLLTIQPNTTVGPPNSGLPVSGGTQTTTPWMPDGSEGYVDDNKVSSTGV